MNIVHVVPEVHPFSSYSSLAESAGSLPRKLRQLGHNVTVFSPFYSSVNDSVLKIKTTGLKTWVDAGFTVYEYELFEAEHKGVKYIFFKNDDLFNRIGLYGTGSFDYADNDIRFGTFCQAAMNYIKYHNIDVDILHAHDWQTALIPVYKKICHNELKCKTVLTVHSVENLGVFSKFSLEALNLPWDIYNINGLEYYDNISFLKGGVAYCDHLTTISPSFADELLSTDNNLGLGGIFSPHEAKLEGILNGISYSRWSPKEDNLIAANYTDKDISGKALCKKAFCLEHGLDDKVPLICYITKLIPARGVELVLDAIKEFGKLRASLIIMGHSGENMNGPLQHAKEGLDNVKLVFGNYYETCHKAYSAADIILMPSLYEPCGITQLIGMRYGALPVVRNTGGLKDGVDKALTNNVGFSFNEFSVEAMMSAVKSACTLCTSDKHEKAIKTVMSFDNSWQLASQKYEKLYTKLMEV